MTETPKVSVIIPTYNYGRFVCHAVESVLAQTWPNIEVIVIDDGSTDDTADRLKPYADKIRYIYQPNRGLSNARNEGIREAAGEYVAFLDADDLWTPQKIEAQMALVAAQQCETVVCVPPNNATADDAFSFADCFLVSPGFGSTALVKRDVFNETGGFDETLRSVEDRDMMLRISVTGRRIGILAGDYVHIRTHDANMSKNAELMEENFRRTLQKIFALPEMRHRYLLKAKALSHYYFDCAWTYFEEGKRMGALVRILKSFLLFPLPTPTSSSGRHMLRLKVLFRILLGDWMRKRPN